MKTEGKNLTSENALTTFLLDEDYVLLASILESINRNQDMERTWHADLIDQANVHVETRHQELLLGCSLGELERSLELPWLSYDDIDNRSIVCYSIARCLDENGTQRIFYIVPTIVAELLYVTDRFSIEVASPESPIGRALLGKNLMETVSVTFPKGVTRLTIIDHHLHFFARKV